MQNKPLRQLFVFSLVSCFVIVKPALAAEMLNFYPTCDYRVIKTVTHTAVIRNDITREDDIITGHEQRTIIKTHLPKMHREILDDAAANGANFVVIKDRELTPGIGNVRLFVTVELLDTCDDANVKEGERAKFNALGQRQGAVKNVNTLRFDYELDFNTHSEPVPLPDNRQVSIQSGLYGLAIGTELDAVIDAFGPPSAWASNDNGDFLIAYGRRHWLTFQNNQMVNTSFGKSPFNATFINYMAFDERFDNREWLIQGEIARDAVLENGIDSPLLIAENEQHSVYVLPSTQLENNQRQRVTRAEGFELKRNTTGDFSFSAAQLTTTIHQTLYDALMALGNDGSLPAEPYTSNALVKMAKDSGRQYFLLNASTLVETFAENVSKIILYPSFLASSSQPFSFGQFYSGQPIDDLKKIAGDNAFYMQDLIEIEQGPYVMKLYLHKKDGLDRLYSIEVSIY